MFNAAIWPTGLTPEGESMLSGQAFNNLSRYKRVQLPLAA